ncbi:hypothetical protein A2U01_0031768 [Trifolium medium]|uniref:Uncharacterized protein n=1 Tax=Trifolium medium TaxID=97028 RepID=A0A392PFW4_9FABA|nr:hypothetical protein [Trifolium medium]
MASSKGQQHVNYVQEGQQKQHAFEEEEDVNYNFQLRSKYLGSSGKWYSTFICQTDHNKPCETL